MDRGPTPREMAKELLNGVPPPRPLCLPIVFSLGAKVENVAPDAFRNNPTKITSALRQMRAPLRADGVTCYFDPFLEVEALGASLRRVDDGSCLVTWPGTNRDRELPDGLCSPEETAQRGRVPIACEVIRRMNAQPNREFLLMAGVTGPLTLAARICGGDIPRGSGTRVVSEAAKEFAASVITQLATAYLEAGADLILIWEDVASALSSEETERWASFLAPAINVARFYEALPVVQFASASAFANSDSLAQLQQDCVVCVPLEVAAGRQRAGNWQAGGTTQGVALPTDIFQPEAPGDSEIFAAVRAQLANLNAAAITTAGDVPPAADMKRLTQVLSYVARAA